MKPLVGYGSKAVVTKRRERKRPNVALGASDAPNATLGASNAPNATLGRKPQPTAAPAPVVAEKPRGGYVPLAKPPVRKLAKDLGVDLHALSGTADGGVITRDDVARAANGSAPATQPSTVDAGYDPGTRERRVPIKGVRKATANAMVQSAFTAPHVTEFLTVDVTPMMELRKRLATLPEFAGVKITPLSLVARAAVIAAKRNPGINASWDEAAQEIVTKHYVNLGIAAATPRGLVVPNIKDADAMTLPELVQALNDLTAVAKEGRTPPADMQGGTITITNVGVFGVDNGTPIINGNEAAILCFGAVREMPWVHEGAIAIRQVTQLSLSFDHRLVDGALGSQFLADVARCLSDPAAFVAWS
jgi:pyruvate dehydrogenase E2 component (dihydrolipoamide acetyltransferase)